MKAELLALRAKTISFNTFAQQTRNEWQKQAEALYRRYRMPAGVEVADVVQEMLMHAWRAVQEWDETRGTDLTKFVTWTAYTNARRWMHVQRNSPRRSDYTPGRYPITYTELTGGDPEASIDTMLHCEPDADMGAIARRKFCELVLELETEGQRIALEAWAVAGNEEQAAALLRKDYRLVSALKLWTEGAAERLVRSAVDAALCNVAAA